MTLGSEQIERRQVLNTTGAGHNRKSRYLYFHRLHGQVTGRFQSFRSCGVPISCQNCKGTKAHQGVCGKSAHILTNIFQLWDPDTPEYLVCLHCYWCFLNLWEEKRWEGWCIQQQENHSHTYTIILPAHNSRNRRVGNLSTQAKGHPTCLHVYI